MGWSYSKNWTKESLIAELTQGWSSGSKTYSLYAKKLDGKELWIVWRVIDGERVTYSISLCLIERYDGEWGYKYFSEEEHPYYYKCPLRFLDMAPEVNEKWREGVRDYWRQKEEYKSLQPGMVVKLKEGSCISEVTLAYKYDRAWHGKDSNNVVWKVPFRLMALK